MFQETSHSEVKEVVFWYQTLESKFEKLELLHPAKLKQCVARIILTNAKIKKHLEVIHGRAPTEDDASLFLGTNEDRRRQIYLDV